MGTVTVVIPVYNGADCVHDAIDSVLSQKGCIKDIVVVNDGSTDETQSVLDRYRMSIKVIEKSNSGARGIGKNRNIGALAGSGDWIAFLDHDDKWLNGKLDAQLSIAHKTSADVIYTNVRNVGESERVLSVAYSPESQLPSGDVFENLLYNNFLFTSSILVRKEAFLNVGGFDDSGAVVEDWDLWLRLAAAGYKFKGTPDVFVEYTWRANSASKRHAEARILRRAAVEAALQTPRGRMLSISTTLKVKANVEATSAWFLAADYPRLSTLWYMKAMALWPFNISYLKGVLKGLLGKSN